MPAAQQHALCENLGLPRVEGHPRACAQISTSPRVNYRGASSKGTRFTLSPTFTLSACFTALGKYTS